eukprot:5102831-Pyramimonas_sp.AAC.1
MATSGIIPRIGYRTKVIPLSPGPLLQLRRSLGRFATPKARGRCLTTALHIDYGDQDPAISLPTAAISLWFEMLASSEAFRKRAARAWPIILKSLLATPQNRQWRKINGLISGTIS